MKRLLIGGATSLAAISLAGVANAQFSTGFVGLSYSGIESTDVITVAGTAALDLNDALEVQVDGNYSNVNVGEAVTHWGGAAHIFADQGSFKAGAVVAFQDFDGAEMTGFGVEGRFAASDNISIGAAVLSGELSPSGSSSGYDVRNYRVEGSFFINDNVRLDASAGQFRLGTGSSSSSHANTTVFSVGGEYQTPDAPVSLFAKVELIDSDLDFTPGVPGNDYENAFTLGVRRTFGGTLRDRDRTSSPFGDALTSFGGSIAGVIGTIVSTGGSIEYGEGTYEGEGT